MWTWLQWILSFLFPQIGSKSQLNSNDSDVLSGRPLGRFERYYCFTPLQRVFCVATQFSSESDVPDVSELAAAMRRLVLQPGFGTAACHIIDSHNEKTARWCAPGSMLDLSSFVAKGIAISQQANISDVLESELSRSFDLRDPHTPLWRLVVIPNSRSLVLSIQHVLTDGSGALYIIQELLKQLKATETNPAKNGANIARVNLMLPDPVEKLLPTHLTLSTVWHTVQRIVSKKPKSFIGPISTVKSSDLTSRVAFRQLSPDQTLKVMSNAKQHDMTVHGVVVAASVRALHAVWPTNTSPCSVRSTINLRSFLSEKHTHLIGNCFTSFSDNIVIDKEVSNAKAAWLFASRYMTALKSSVMQEWQHQDNLLRLVCTLGISKTLSEDISKLHNLRDGTIELLNLGSLHLQGVDKLDLVQGTSNNSPLLLIGVVTINQRINLSLSYSSPLVSEKEANSFLDAVQAALSSD